MTDINIQLSQNIDVNIYIFQWELDTFNNDKTFDKLYTDLWNFDKKIIFDFSNLTYIDSRSISYVFDIYDMVDKNWWKLFICNCNFQVRDVFELVWITTIIPCFDDIEEALEEIRK